MVVQLQLQFVNEFLLYISAGSTITVGKILIHGGCELTVVIPV